MATAFMASTQHGEVNQVFALIPFKNVVVMNGAGKVVRRQKNHGEDQDFVEDRGEEQSPAW